MKLLSLIFSLLICTVNAPAQKGIEILPKGKEQIYKAEFNLTGTTMNGFLAVHHRRNHTLHVSFTSPMGNNLLEMRWRNGHWKKIHAIKELGGRRTFEMMAEDILLLFAHYQFDRGFEDLGSEWKWGKKKLLPEFSDGSLVSVKVVTKRHRPTKTVKYEFGEKGIDEMSINHQGFPFSIALEPIRKK